VIGYISVQGVIFGVLASLATALNAIYTKKILGVINNCIWTLTMYNNFLATVLLIPIVIISGEIDADKPTAGVLRFSMADGTDDRYRYSSYNGGTFVLDAYQGLLAGPGGSSTLLVHPAGDYIAKGIKAGDAIRNVTDISSARVVTVNTTGQLTTTALAGGIDNTWSEGDTYEIGTLTTQYFQNNPIYVPYIDLVATTSTAAVSIQYVEDTSVTVRVRRKGILPFSQVTSFTSSNFTVSAIRTEDTIVTL